jgi:hypothetical protein
MSRRAPAVSPYAVEGGLLIAGAATLVGLVWISLTAMPWTWTAAQVAPLLFAFAWLVLLTTVGLRWLRQLAGERAVRDAVEHDLSAMRRRVDTSGAEEREEREALEQAYRGLLRHLRGLDFDEGEPYATEGALRLKFATPEVPLDRLVRGLSALDELYQLLGNDEGRTESPTITRIQKGSLWIELLGSGAVITCVYWVMKHPRQIGAWPKRVLEGWRDPDTAPDPESVEAQELRAQKVSSLVQTVVSSLGDVREARIPHPTKAQIAELPEEAWTPRSPESQD